MDEEAQVKILKNKKRGSAIAYALVIISMISIILASVVQFVASQAKGAYQVQSKEQAFQIAEAGVNFYRWYLAHQTDGRTALQVRDFWQSTSPYPYGLEPNGDGGFNDYDREYVDGQGGVIGKYSISVEPPDVGSTIVNVTVTGWTYKHEYTKRSIKVRFRRPSWSENSVLANDFMRFGEGTMVNGKIHSNLGIRFDGVATNVVSSSLNAAVDPDHGGNAEFGVHTHRNIAPITGFDDSQRPLEAPPNAVTQRADIFNAGRKFPAPQIDFSSVVSDISYMRTQAAKKFDNSGQGRRIILKTDGTFDVCKVEAFDSGTNGITKYAGVIAGATGVYAVTNGSVCSGATVCCNNGTVACNWISDSKHAKGKCVSMANYPIPDKGIIFVANNLWLEGIINNKNVTLVAAELSDEPGYTSGNKNVFLGMDNLLYTILSGDTPDIIGVIAQKNVEIIKDSLNVLTIDAALLAKEGRVGRVNYGSSNKSTITVNGSIATNIRYGFAYTGTAYDCGSGVKVGDGYCFRKLNFDNNLLYHPPPYFPTGTQYAIDLWEEVPPKN